MYRAPNVTDWLVCCLLAGLDLWKRMPLNCSSTMVCTLLSWCEISNHFKENNNLVVFPFPFHIFMPLTNLWFIRLQGYCPILRTRSSLDLYPLIRPPKRRLALGRGRILIPGFIRSPPTLAVYDVAHSLPLGGAGRGSPSLRMRPEGISHTSGTLEGSPVSQVPLSRNYPWWMFEWIFAIWIGVSTRSWMDSAQDRHLWKILVNAALNFQVP